MDELFAHLDGKESSDPIETAFILRCLDEANAENGGPWQLDGTNYGRIKAFFSRQDTVPVEMIPQLLEALIVNTESTHPTNMSQVQPDGDAALPASYTANIFDDGAREVPGAVTDGAAAALESTSRRRTSPMRRQPQSSTAEATRLRGRRLAAMTDEEYAVRAEAAQPGLLDEIADYASRAGLGPSGSARPAADGYATHTDYAAMSDPEQSGFSTPHVSRKAIRQRMRTVARASNPGAGSAYDMPISPESSAHELRSPVRELRSPARYAELDDGSKQYIEDLLSKKAELQKLVTEKQRRLEMLEGLHDKRTVALEREIDECRGQLTTKKREIERLKQSEKSYIESLHTAEGEIERIGVNLSNSTAQAAELRRQLDTKGTQLTESNQRALEYQSEIVSLKSGLGANHHQQEQLAREHRRLELQYRELEHELKAAREFRDEAVVARKENRQLSETIDTLKRELTELRLQEQQSPTPAIDDPGAAGQLRARHRFRSLRDELATSDGLEAATVAQEQLDHEAVRQWIGTALGRCSAEDMVVLNEVWRRIGYCDTSTESQAELRRELVEVFMAPYKYGLKEALRGQSNPTLTRIVDSVAGEYMRMSAGGKLNEKSAGKGAHGLAQVLAHGQYTTAAIILYSVVVFCLGIITASYFNLAQPMATSVPAAVVNGTMPGDGAMNAMRHILVVDDTPVHKYYTPLRKRSPRSRFGEILVYWAETLLWDDADTQVPT
ncbi:hypothetical protein H4R19_004538 [Coemansia spiralis]|nr:hypothetical protein H4R19_004538 [Coemansia spiralis]